MSIFAEYTKQIETALKAGNATEHTYRPLLKNLIESFAPNVVAINEPKRINCGAPDYLISHRQQVLG